LLPSPLATARALDALGLASGERLLVAETRVGWTTLVAGAYAALTGGRAATSAALADPDAHLAGPLAALEVATAPRPPAGSGAGGGTGAAAGGGTGSAAACAPPFDAVLAFGDRPDPGLLGPRGRAVWTDEAAGRIRRLERNPPSWRLVDLGPAHAHEVAR
jgi:hypothetical protein